MARDRKRAKQRRDRRGAARPGTRAGQATSPARPPEPHKGELQREDLPGELEHASSPADEFDAALVRGADGVPAETEPEPAVEDELQELQPAVAAGGRGGAGQAPAAAHGSGAPLRGGNRVAGFLSASWAELQRVQWPDRRQVAQATAVVLGFVAVAGVYLGVADYVAKEIVEFIL